MLLLHSFYSHNDINKNPTNIRRRNRQRSKERTYNHILEELDDIALEGEGGLLQLVCDRVINRHL